MDHLTAARGSHQRFVSNRTGNYFGQIVKQFADKKQFSSSFLADSLKLLNIDGTLEIERIEGSGSTVYLKTDHSKILLSDLGYGYSQIIPILFQIIILSYNKEYESEMINPYIGHSVKQILEEEKIIDPDNNMDSDKILNSIDFKKFYRQTQYPILIIEEPESNLHPDLQSKLADIFYLAYKSLGIHFIIETHSEYFIRKFQYLIASDNNEMKSNNLAVYYFNNPNKLLENTDKQVYKLNIRDDGFMDNDFGKGFFDESTSLSLSLLSLKNLN